MGFASPHLSGHALDLHHAHTSDLPVTGVVESYPAGHVVPMHSHPRGHLIYASTGVLRVQAITGQWLVPPTTAVWLRPSIEHQLTAVTGVTAHGILIAETITADLPPMDCVVHVSPLMRELIAALVSVPHQPPFQPRDALLGELLVEELTTVAQLPFHLPWPNDKLISKVCDALVRDPGQTSTAEALAQRYAITSKTLHRRFLKSTGMNFGQWRLKMRLMKSIEKLLQGLPITHVALESGYESHSAYSVAFKKTFACPPSQFIAAAYHSSKNAEVNRPGFSR